MVTRYQKRISRPLMDRIDIHMQVPRVEYAKLRDMRQGESSAEVRARVEEARERQCVRFEDMGIAGNADMRPTQMPKFYGLEKSARTLFSLISFFHLKVFLRHIKLNRRRE